MPRFAWVALAIGVLAALGVGAFLSQRRAGPTDSVGQPARIIRVSEDHWIVPRSTRDNYLSDPQRLNRDLRLKPVEGDNAGEIRSLVVEFVENNSPMHTAGFRKGDRILEVNGSPVATMKRAVNLVNEVRQSTLLTVRVQRDSKQTSFKIEFP